jgi:mono/diheme cytochrome c family protein
VQPVFDRHCGSCHSGLKPASGLDFSGGLTEKYNRAYDTIQAAGLVSRSNVGDDAKITTPLMFGSHKSRIIEVIRGSHRDRVKLGEEDWLRLVTWIDANAPYHGGFINKRLERPPYDLVAARETLDQITAIHAHRCASCHEAAAISRSDWIDLHTPERSRFLTAPLAKEAGGAARCQEAVYADTSDADYRAVRTLVEEAVRKAWESPRRDVATLDRPRQIASGSDPQGRDKR